MADSFRPIIYWGQNKDCIFIKVDITDITSGPEVDLNEDHLKFKAQGSGACGINMYSFNVDFYLQVDPKNSKYRVTGRTVEFECKKVGRGEVWPRLTEQPIKLPWLKTDFDHFAFNDSDASSDEELTPSQKEMLDKLEKEVTAAETNIVQDLKLLYLFIYNLFQWIGFSYIFGMICIQWYLYGHESRKNTFLSVGPALMICQSAAILEILHPMLGWVKTGVFMSFMQVFGRSFILFGLLAVEPKLQNHELVFYLFLAWSAIEIVRYPYYMLATMGKDWSIVTWLRYTTWIPLYPMGAVCEGLIMLVSLPHFDLSKKWSFDLPNDLNCSFQFPMILRVYMIIFIPGVYLLIQRMYEQRKKKLNVKQTSRISHSKKKS